MGRNSSGRGRNPPPGYDLFKSLTNNWVESWRKRSSGGPSGLRRKAQPRGEWNSSPRMPVQLSMSDMLGFGERLTACVLGLGPALHQVCQVGRGALPSRPGFLWDFFLPAGRPPSPALFSRGMLYLRVSPISCTVLPCGSQMRRPLPPISVRRWFSGLSKQPALQGGMKGEIVLHRPHC
jgi:hypothetical protein